MKGKSYSRGEPVICSCGQDHAAQLAELERRGADETVGIEESAQLAHGLFVLVSDRQKAPILAGSSEADRHEDRRGVAPLA